MRIKTSQALTVLLLTILIAIAASYLVSLIIENSAQQKTNNEQINKIDKENDNSDNTIDDSNQLIVSNSPNQDGATTISKTLQERLPNPNGNNKYIAYYGSPQYPELGVMGKDSFDNSVTKIKALAAEYQALDPASNYVPTIEIIATVASANAQDDNSYSEKSPINLISEWVEKAGAADVYVILDLQPGRQDFLTQAKLYEDLLKLDHVGLGLDPEWRIKNNQVHLKQIGTVDATEINETHDWLSNLVETNNLPQKMLVLHQFTESMITNRETVQGHNDSLQVVLHMDGQGTKQAKIGTHSAITRNLQTDISVGWKNFFEKDVPGVMSPTETLEVNPQPMFITYQ